MWCLGRADDEARAHAPDQDSPILPRSSTINFVSWSRPAATSASGGDAETRGRTTCHDRPSPRPSPSQFNGYACTLSTRFWSMFCNLLVATSRRSCPPLAPRPVERGRGGRSPYGPPCSCGWRVQHQGPRDGASGAVRGTREAPAHVIRPTRLISATLRPWDPANPPGPCLCRCGRLVIA